MTPDEMYREITEIKVEIANARTEKDKLESSLSVSKDNFKLSEEAIQVLASVLSITQQSVVGFIEETVSMALQYVYDETYSFKIEFELKRNQPEVKLIPMKDDLEYDPKFSCGVGVIDVCSFALRMALWALKEPKTAPIIVLDECFKNLHGVEVNEKVGMMVKKLSEMLGLQIIIVSGASPITNYADKVFTVTQQNGRSIVNG